MIVAILMATTVYASGSITLLDTEFKVDTVYHANIGPGTSQTSLLLTGPSYNLTVFYLTADLTTDKLSIKTVAGDDQLSGGEKPSSMASRYSYSGNTYFAGVNGDFYSTSGTSSNGTSIVGTPTAALISSGEIFKSSAANQQFIIDTDGNPVVGRAYFTSGTASCGEENVMFKSVNVTSTSNALTLYTNRYYGNSNQTSREGNCAEVTAKLVEGETFAAGGTFKMEVTSVSNSTGDSEIPEDGFVIHGYGTDTSGGGTIGAKTFVEGLSIGDIVTFNSVIKVDDVEVKPYQIISGNPRTMGDGEVLDTESERTDASSYHPRSGIGYGNDGKRVIMMVVDGRTSVSNGVRTSQLGEIMKYAGATDAINLDGGGSSTLYTLPLGIRNSPSDGNERAVGSAIFLVNGNEDDDVIASIGFEDWAKVFPKYGVYSPVIYGYNQYGMLIDTDVQGFELSCPVELGRIEGDMFVGDGEGTYALTAEYNGLVATIPVTVAVTEDIGFRLESVINDTYREYAVEVNAVLDGDETSLDSSALTWSTADADIVEIDCYSGVLKGVADGEAVVIGTVGDFTGELTVIVEKPESNVMAVDPDMDVDTWTVTQVGGSGITKEAYENGVKLTYTGASGRSNYIRLAKSNRLWSLPDAIRIRFNPGDAPITSVVLTTMDSNGVGYSTTFEDEIVANEENIIELATDDWCGSDDISNFPLYLTQIQFGMGTSTTGTEYVVEIPGLECVYDSAPASVEGVLADSVADAVIYPNPINMGSEAFVSGLADGKVNIMIYSLIGELVSSSSVECVGGVFAIPASNLLAGVYFVKVDAADGESITKKLIVK